MKKLLLLMALVLSFGLASFAEEASYTITFNDNDAGDATSDITASAVLSYITEGSEYVSSASGIYKVYQGKTGLKFSASKTNGSITLNLSEAGQVEATKVVVNAANWVSNKGVYDSASLKVNNLTAQNCSDEFANYTFAITPATKITSIKLDATKRLYVKSITVYYEDNGSTITKEPAGLAFTEEAYTANLGEDFTTPELTNPNGLEVTYKSSNEAVATVTTDGTVNILTAGTTTITATSEETEVFKAGEASYKLTVIDPNSTEDKIVFESLGYSDGTALTTVTKGKSTLTFAKGSNSNNAPKYYVSDKTARLYSGNTLTIAVDESCYITEIVFGGSTLGALTASAGSYNNETWTPTVARSDNKISNVTFTATGKPRFSSITVKYALIPSGIADIEAEENGAVEYFNLQGVRVAEPANGLYIRRAGNKVEKVVIR